MADPAKEPTPLRQVRETAGLSVEEQARRMAMAESVVLDLEHDAGSHGFEAPRLPQRGRPSARAGRRGCSRQEDGDPMSADLETRIRRDVVVTDTVEVEARRQRKARNRLAVVQTLGITAVVAGLFAGLYPVAVEVDQMRRRTRQIEASLVAEPTEVAKTKRRSHATTSTTTANSGKWRVSASPGVVG
jgi:cytoskeletal protein RodZ